MLAPKRVKYRNRQKGRMRGAAKGGNRVSFGDYGLQALQAGRITARQIEAARVAITRAVKKAGKVYIRIFPDKPYSKKPAETRMGKGKGALEGYVAVVKPGRVIFELEGVGAELAKHAFTHAHHKLPLKTQVISREPVI